MSKDIFEVIANLLAMRPPLTREEIAAAARVTIQQADAYANDLGFVYRPSTGLYAKKPTTTPNENAAAKGPSTSDNIAALLTKANDIAGSSPRVARALTKVMDALEALSVTVAEDAGRVELLKKKAALEAELAKVRAELSSKPSTSKSTPVRSGTWPKQCPDCGRVINNAQGVSLHRKATGHGEFVEVAA